MKYSFFIHKNIQFGWEYFRLKVEEEKYSVVQNVLTSDDWTPQKVQAIIDGIKRSKTLPKGEEYYWGNEAVDLYSNENGLLLVDNLAQRAKQYDPDVITLRLTHDEMINFLKDFKKFVEENS